jgi:hypothetical protein
MPEYSLFVGKLLGVYGGELSGAHGVIFLFGRQGSRDGIKKQEARR